MVQAGLRRVSIVTSAADALKATTLTIVLATRIIGRRPLPSGRQAALNTRSTASCQSVFPRLLSLRYTLPRHVSSP